MQAAILIALLAAQTPTVPQQVAHKALAGEFGALAAWQKEGYQAFLADPDGTTRHTAWVTCYSSSDPGCNETTASGRTVSSRVAAMRRSQATFGTFVLISLPSGMELRQVWDTGAKYNIPNVNSEYAGPRNAARRGATHWCDRWLSYPSKRTWVRSIYLVKAR